MRVNIRRRGGSGAASRFQELTALDSGGLRVWRSQGSGSVYWCGTFSETSQFLNPSFGEVPGEEGFDFRGSSAAVGSTGFKIPTQPLARVQFPKSQCRQNRKHHHRQASSPLGSRTVVVLATHCRIADQTLTRIIVERNPWIIDEQRQPLPMFLQAGQRFAAWFATVRHHAPQPWRQRVHVVRRLRRKTRKS